jgi:predicted NAD/FAD-binding protein
MASARVSSYVPAVTEFATDLSEPKEGKKVIVIGGGCGGLGAAWHLNRCGYDVELFEANEKAGGHANTVNGEF